MTKLIPLLESLRTSIFRNRSLARIVFLGSLEIGLQSDRFE